MFTKEQEKHKAEQTKYNEALEKYNKDMIKAVLPHISKYTSGGVFKRYNSINVDVHIPLNAVVLPDEPVRPVYNHTALNVWQQLEEVNNAIRILKMTDDETVSTSTFNKIAQYL